MERVLNEIDKWVQRGFYIDYDVTDQFENGFVKQVEEGNMPRYLYILYYEI